MHTCQVLLSNGLNLQFHIMILSAENQKGVSAVEGYSVENQKGVIAIDFIQQ